MRRTLLLAALALAGCGSQDRRPAADPVREVVHDYFDSILADDDARTCELYSTRARVEIVAGASTVNCRAALAQRLYGLGMAKLVRDRFQPAIVRVKVAGERATVTLRPSRFTTFARELRLVGEDGRWRIDSDQPDAGFTPAGFCIWGYVRQTLQDPEWKPWSDRAKAEYTVRFCEQVVKRGLMKVDHGLRLARVESDVVSQLYDEGLMTLR